jgi:broad specificity phosphatase PhoE
MSMEKIYFISHPEVTVDKSIPITEWDLSPEGLERLGQLLEKPWIPEIDAVYASNEKKAITTAKHIAERLHLPVTYMEELGETNRSSTEFLEPNEFEQTADAFFAHPDQNVRGWESAISAQKRIVAAIEVILRETREGENIAIVSHGGVGSLLISHLKGTPIDRAEDQPGQGHYFVFERATKRLLHTWQPIS